jgi:polyphosphate glucokinase
MVRTLVELAADTGVAYDRASVGFPGMVRGGIVRATPHYVTAAGPFTARRPDLVEQWHDYDVQSALQRALGVPTRVLNDAEIAGLAVIERTGFEVMFTLGTGLGFASFDDGRLLPKIELSQARGRGGVTFDERLGHHTRKRIGGRKWSRRVRRVLDDLRPVLWWDRAYLGGGGAKHLTEPLGSDVTVVTNLHGLLGGVRLWD